MIILAIYAAIFIASFFLVRLIVDQTARGFDARKTVTFGDESAVVPNRIASVVSVLSIFVLWGAFTGSALLPGFLHAPGPFEGVASFTYTAEADDGTRDDATVTVLVHPVNQQVDAPVVDPGEGWARNDSDTIGTWRSGLIRVDRNDEKGRDQGHRVVAVNGTPIAPGGEVMTEFGRVGMSPKGTLNFEPAKGWQMEPIWLPSPEAVVARLVEISDQGYRDSTLWEHLGYSLFRVVVGFFFGALIGIPLGYAMGLSNWFRGWFDPIVEFMRPVPPLALIPLVPNSLPEIFTGARVAMGVCWGTVVAAELVAAEKGAGMMIMVASKFQLTDIVIMGIILIGIIGFGIDILMRRAEKWLVPWKGRS